MHDARLIVLRCLDLIAMDTVEQCAFGRRPIGLSVIERRRIALRVPFLARRGAGLAADTGVEIDDKTELFLIGLRGGKRRHARLPATSPRRLFSTGNCGELIASSSDAFSIRTRRSYHAAWPVTGSELE